MLRRFAARQRQGCKWTHVRRGEGDTVDRNENYAGDYVWVTKYNPCWGDAGCIERTDDEIVGNIVYVTADFRNLTFWQIR
jgi:hypothetical protein